MSDAINITLNDPQVLARLEEAKRLGGSQVLMAGIAQVMKTSTQMRFRTQTGPDGKRWVPSKAALKRGGQTLVDTSRLRNSWTTEAAPFKATVGTNVPYAKVYQQGFKGTVQVGAHKRTSKRDNRKAGRVSVRTGNVRAHARKVNIVARPMAGFSAQDVVVIRGRIEQFIARKLSR